MREISTLLTQTLTGRACHIPRGFDLITVFSHWAAASDFNSIQTATNTSVKGGRTFLTCYLINLRLFPRLLLLQLDFRLQISGLACV